ncbi:MAG: pseudouridine synthase [Neisseriaceae bacterium]|nr:pseudouridine synthase [Neisseriaceae bacterium]
MKPSSPLPNLNGLSASRTALTPGTWLTMWDFLRARFPFLSPADLAERLALGKLVTDAGFPIQAETRYQSGGYLWYYREVHNEVPVPFEVNILYQDDSLLVVDKPPFLPTAPVGQFVHETVLSRLRRDGQFPDIAPIHRLDRETRGVMLFCLKKTHRAAYQTLFASRDIRKTYEAIASLVFLPQGWPQHKISCLLPSQQHFFTMQEDPNGQPNTETWITLLETHGAWGRYELMPKTGKKHQLRVHMAALGAPILNDDWYPSVTTGAHEGLSDFSRPLQLMAKRIQFTDPVTGDCRDFSSQLSLDFP